MAMSVGGGAGDYKSDINITPLVDVVLVLLIIFMVITPLLQMGYEVKVPPKIDQPESSDRPGPVHRLARSAQGKLLPEQAGADRPPAGDPAFVDSQESPRQDGLLLGRRRVRLRRCRHGHGPLPDGRRHEHRDRSGGGSGPVALDLRTTFPASYPARGWFDILPGPRATRATTRKETGVRRCLMTWLCPSSSSSRSARSSSRGT